FAVERSSQGPFAGAPEACRRFLPLLAFERMGSQCGIVRFECPGIEVADRVRGLAVQQAAPRRQQLAVDDLADTVMRELEALPDDAKNPPAHKLLDSGFFASSGSASSSRMT